MSPVSLGLDGLLILLLVTAMAVGLRLNRKLKDLRESQGAFIKAVGELDVAAMRAESGLQALRDATVEAHDQLLTRIETARGLAARLDRVTPEAEAAAAEALDAAASATAAADSARRAAAAAVARAASAPRPSAPAEDVVVALRPRAEPEIAPETNPSEERSAERAAALFLEERAARLASGFSPVNDLADALPSLRAEPVSRLQRFKARRAGVRT